MEKASGRLGAQAYTHAGSMNLSISLVIATDMYCAGNKKGLDPEGIHANLNQIGSRQIQSR